VYNNHSPPSTTDTRSKYVHARQRVTPQQTQNSSTCPRSRSGGHVAIFGDLRQHASFLQRSSNFCEEYICISLIVASQIERESKPKCLKNLTIFK
jgi:hypothetical protein